MLSILLALISLLFPPRVLAISKFNSSYQIYYKVEKTGNTHVTVVVNQKNNLSVVFATDYGISLNQTKVDNVRVSDDGTLVVPEVNKGQNQTTISFPFANKVVGKDKVHKFSIEYDTSDIASRNGNTWQINIPRLETDDSISDNTAILNVPDDFEKPAYIDPKPDMVNGNTYYFSSKVLANKSISAIFGENQYYKASLKYNLQNTDNQRIKTEIAIPPNTAYQSIYIESIDPKPEEIKTDIDGNLLATYHLNPNEEKVIILKMYFRMSFMAKNDSNNLPGDNLAPNKVWDYDNIAFTSEELKNLTTPKSIYDFVANKLKYDFQKINRSKPERFSGSQILLNPQSAICTDFTDLFVTLARKAKIPTREIEGLALSDNPNLKPVSTGITDVLHAWPEYFDSTRLRWIQIDPTWGSTTRGIDYFNKLDFNHLTFVIHGQDPEYPVPAGGYKIPNQKEKDVEVQAVEKIDFPTPSLETSFYRQDGHQLTFEIKNVSGVYFNGDVTVKETPLTFQQIESVTVPPFSSVQIKVFLKSSTHLGITQQKAIINANGQSQEVKFLVTPYLSKGPLLASIAGLLGIVAWFAWRLLFRR